MSSPATGADLGHPAGSDVATYEAALDRFVADVIKSVEQDMGRQPAPMVYEILSMQLARRLPGVEVSHEVLVDAAARIAAGLPGI